jgi:hypothetical protein
MIRKPRDLPPAVARAFVKDMEAYFAEEDRHQRDEIALRQLRVLREHQGPREEALGLLDAKLVRRTQRSRKFLCPEFFEQRRIVCEFRY